MKRDRRAINIEKFTLANSLPSDWIVDNFTLGELTKSDIAIRHGISNWFRTDAQLQSAVFTCRNVLQPIRAGLGPFTPNSVFRSQALERALKKKPTTWRSTSQHTLGQAADIEVPGMTNLALAEWINKYVKFDQLILEFYIPGHPDSGWIHVSTRTGREKNREQVMTFDGKNYLSGIRI